MRVDDCHSLITIFTRNEPHPFEIAWLLPLVGAMRTHGLDVGRTAQDTLLPLVGVMRTLPGETTDYPVLLLLPLVGAMRTSPHLLGQQRVQAVATPRRGDEDVRARREAGPFVDRCYPS